MLRVRDVPLTMRHGHRPDSTLAEELAPLPGTHPRTSGCWRSTDPP